MKRSTKLLVLGACSSASAYGHTVAAAVMRDAHVSPRLADAFANIAPLCVFTGFLFGLLGLCAAAMDGDE